MTRRPYKSTTLRMLVHFVWVRGTCETSQVLLARVPGGFYLGVLPFSPHLPVGPSHMSYDNIERDVKRNKNCSVLGHEHCFNISTIDVPDIA